MKPFEKNGTSEQEAGYYRDYLQGWLSSGQNNSSASEDDKKASFWFFDEEFANEVNKFTNYAIPESPDSKATGISGSTSSEIEPFMLMKATLRLQHRHLFLHLHHLRAIRFQDTAATVS